MHITISRDRRSSYRAIAIRKFKMSTEYYTVKTILLFLRQITSISKNYDFYIYLILADRQFSFKNFI